MVSVWSTEVTIHTTCCTLDTPYLPDGLYRMCENSLCACARKVLDCAGSGKLLYIKRFRWHKWPVSHSHGCYFQHFTAARSTVHLSVSYIIPDVCHMPMVVISDTYNSECCTFRVACTVTCVLFAAWRRRLVPQRCIYAMLVMFLRLNSQSYIRILVKHNLVVRSRSAYFYFKSSA
jgi:hypothetical protein